MKKITRMTALLLAAAICLTSCSGANESSYTPTYDYSTEKAETTAAAVTTTVTSTEAARETTSQTTAALVTTAVQTTTSATEVTTSQTAAEPFFTEEYEYVEDLAVTFNGKNATYTGWWLGEHPETYGTLKIGDDFIYMGNWHEGILSGECVVSEKYNDGYHYSYVGEYYGIAPSGQGKMKIESDKDQYLTEIEGDFTNESSLFYATTDKEQKRITDAGYIQNGEYISYLDKKEPTNPVFPINISNLNCMGEYNGHLTDGIPNGSGYFITEEVTLNNGEKGHIGLLGNWNNGSLSGKFTELDWGDGFSTEVLFEFDQNGQLIGDYELYGRTSDRLTVFTTDYSSVFVRSDDGLYRSSSDTTTEIYWDNGIMEYYATRVVADDANGSGARYEGEYYKYDANNEVMDYGLQTEIGEWVSVSAVNNSSDTSSPSEIASEDIWYQANETAGINNELDGVWYRADDTASSSNSNTGSGSKTSLSDRLKSFGSSLGDKAKKVADKAVDLGLVIGVGVLAYKGIKWAFFNSDAKEEWENSSAYKYVQDNRKRCEEETKKFNADKKEYERLMEEARAQQRIGNTYEAQRLYEQAQKIKPSYGI